jgi:hypothetical protein
VQAFNCICLCDVGYTESKVLIQADETETCGDIFLKSLTKMNLYYTINFSLWCYV